MAAQTEVTAVYRADTSSFVRGTKQAQAQASEFARSMGDAQKSADQLKTSTVAVGTALGGLALKGISMATAKVKQFAMQGVNAAKDYEQTVISIEGIFQGMGMSVGEATEKTAQYLADLRDFAAKTPFELPQTLDAVKRLLSIGYAADDVKDRLLPTIGDIVSALGQPPQSISAVVYAFGQMKSAGRVLTQDLMQIGNALPGFNAKMAIAAEMFEGDLDAMNDAMQKGAVSSEAAIDAILSAMQKFGGAQGAMARQSETLAGVMSTFSDTVNNALIDGLMPSLPTLSATLNDVMPAVEGVATAFAQALGPALISGAEVMGQMAPAASAVIPPLIELVGQFTVVGDAIAAMSPFIEAMASLMGLAVDALKLLPDPMFAAIGAMLLVRLAMKKMGVESLAMSGTMGRNFKVAARAVQINAVSMGSSLTGMQMRMQTLGAVSKMSLMGMVGSLRAAGTAIKGFMLSMGPIGWAITAATVAMEIFMGKSAETEERVASLRDTVDEATGAFTKLTAAQITSNLYDLYSDEDIQRLVDAGIYIGDIGNAIIAGGKVADDYRAHLEAVKKEYIAMGTVGGENMARLLNIVINDFDEQRDAANEAAAAVRRKKEEEQASVSSIIAVKEAHLDYQDAAVRAKARTDELASGAAAAAQRSEELAAAQEAYTLRVEEAAAATERMDDALNALNENLSAAESAWAAEESLKELGKAAEKFGGDLLGSGGKAREFQKLVVGAMGDAIKSSQQLGDTAEETRDLFVGQMAGIVTALTDAGFKKKDVEAFLGAFPDLPASVEEIMGAAAIAAGKGADNFQTSVANNIEKAWKSGEIMSLAAAENMAQAAADKAEQDLGLKLTPQMQSAVEAAGIAVGPTATAAGEDVGSNFVLGTVAGMAANMGYVDAIVREIIRNAKQAADEESKSRSPSRLFAEVGDNLIQGLRLGWNNGSYAFIDDIARTVQDAFWSMKDAEDRVKDAKKALQDVRKARKDGEASAREVAAAERDLAKAYRDSEDAAAAYAAAQEQVNATRKLSKMNPPSIDWGSLLDEFNKSGDVDKIWDALSDKLYNQARRAGLTRDAAQAYVDSMLDSVMDQVDRKVRRLEKLQDELSALQDQIDEVRKTIAEREAGRSDIEKLLESRFGQPSEFAKAYNAAEISIDDAIGLFDRLKELVEQRFTGTEGNGDDIIRNLEGSTARLVKLIGARDTILGQLEESRKTLTDLTTERDNAEKKLIDSVTKFSAISGKITSADEYVLGLQQRVDATKQYVSDVNALRKRGLSEDVIQQMLDAGVETGGSFAAALAGATDEQLAQINTLTAQSQTIAQEFGSDQAEIMYGAAITAQQKLVEGYEAQYEEVTAAIQEQVLMIQREMEPLAEVGMAAGDDLIQGTLDALEAREAELMAKIRKIGEQIQAAWNQAISGVGGSTGGGAGSGSGGGGKGNNKNRRAGTSRAGTASVPSIPVMTAMQSGISVAAGGVQVSVQVGSDQDPAVVKDATRSAVMEALAEVAAQAANSRR